MQKLAARAARAGSYSLKSQFLNGFLAVISAIGLHRTAKDRRQVVS